MALHAASSIHAFVGPGGCAHYRDVVTEATDTEEAVYAPEFQVDCPTCEPVLATMKGAWGPVNKPAPLTGDEQDVLQAQQDDANRSLLAGLAQLPQVLAGLVAQNAGIMETLQNMAPKAPETPKPAVPTRQPRQGQKR